MSCRASPSATSVVLLQTKSGTSRLHGAAWEFLRNDKFNSKPYFAPQIFPYKQNIFGYNIGGPVFLPGCTTPTGRGPASSSRSSSSSCTTYPPTHPLSPASTCRTPASRIHPAPAPRRPQPSPLFSNADQNIQATQIQTHSVGIQHEFAHNWVAAVTGASSQARHLVATINLNQPRHAGAFDFDPRLNFDASIKAVPSPYEYLPSKGIQFSPYPGYGAISTLIKEFHFSEANFFEFRAEAFNVLNHTNFTTISANVGSSTYGQATAATDPRILEFALRYHF